MERAHLGFERALPDRDDAPVPPAVEEPAGRGEQVRVVLLAAEVGDRARDLLVGPDAELDPHLVAVDELRAHLVEQHAVHHDLGPAPEPRPDRLVHLARHREVGVVERVGDPVQDPGRRREARERVVHRVDEARPDRLREAADDEPRDPGRVRRLRVEDVHRVPQQPGPQACGPAQVALVLHVEAVGADAERLEVRDQRVLPRQQVLDVEAEPVAVVDGRGRDHEVLRPARARAPSPATAP